MQLQTMNKKYDVIFLGLAKNVASTINLFFDSVERISKSNIKIKIIIGENGSKDDTREILKNTKHKNFDLDVIELDDLKKIKNRILRLGKGRQILKEYLESKSIISKFVGIIDLDEVMINGINENQFLNSIKLLEENKSFLFGISAKSKPFYYDLLPLIIENYFEIDVYSIQTKVSLLDLYSVRKKNIYDFQIRITKMRDVETISSHNGLTIYFYDDFIQGNYQNNPNSKIVSEHINLNKSVYQLTNKKILMNNDLVLKTPMEHMPFTKKQFFIHQIKKLNEKF